MNINTLSEIVDSFNNEIVDSGFKRDLTDYLSSLSNNQNNIIGLRDIANKVSHKLELIYSGDLPDMIKKLFANNVKSFTSESHDNHILELLKDNEIALPNFYQKLHKLLTALNNQIELNTQEIIRLKTFIDPYVETQEEYQTDEQKAIVSIIFNDSKTITNLKEFTKTLNSWNKVLPLYHQILKSSKWFYRFSNKY
jgi:hypothetical protein